VKVMLEKAKAELRRHKRKYAAGELGEDKSFYFRGPQGKTQSTRSESQYLCANREGVDDET